jgi:hypothetical protein
MKVAKPVFLGLTLLVLYILFGGGMAEGQSKPEAKAEDKISIGVVEDVILLPWGVKIPARVDTGAAVSSLDARELVVNDGVAEFRLPEKYGGTKITLPVVQWRTVRSAGGQQERPVVRMSVCVGPKVLKIKVNLVNRSHMTYPLIVGRNILKKGYVVDCLCANILKPSCPEAGDK